MRNCPNCGGMLLLDYDGYEKYLNCLICGHDFDLKGGSRSFTPEEYLAKYGIKLTRMEEHAAFKRENEVLS